MPGEVRNRPDRACADGQARSSYRARHGNPRRHPHTFEKDKEQSSPHRRTRRRQDRHRRRTCAAHRARRRAGGSQGPHCLFTRHDRAYGRSHVPRPVRGAIKGHIKEDKGVRGEDNPLHRRNPHHRRRGKDRGLLRRGQHAQAPSRSRRASLRRRDDARRVPQVHGVRQGARAPLPARAGRCAERGGRDLDTARHQGALREVPQRAHPRRGACERRRPLLALYPGPIPPRQGDRPSRRGVRAHQDGNGFLSAGTRRDIAARQASRDRGDRAQKGKGRELQEAARRASVRAKGSQGEVRRDDSAMEARKGRP